MVIDYSKSKLYRKNGNGAVLLHRLQKLDLARDHVVVPAVVSSFFYQLKMEILMDRIRIKHVPVNRVHIMVFRDIDNSWAELDIAESTWWKVSNGVSRILIGKAYIQGDRIKSYWSFSPGSLSILNNDEQVMFTCNLSDVIESE